MAASKKNSRPEKILAERGAKYPLLSSCLFLLLGSVLLSCDNETKCSGPANYTVKFNSTWSYATHPEDFPYNPHFSGLIGAAHNDDVTFWEQGETASTGIERMAETGSKAGLTSEITAAINAGNAKSILSGGGIGSSPGSVSLQFDVDADYPKITLVSMLAPSPDWFVGISGVELCKREKWLSSKSIDLYAYDAGTDSGTTYTSADNDTNPKEKITQLGTGSFEVNGTVPTVGTFEFTKN